SAIEQGLAGKPSSRPIMWGLIPSLASPGLAPHGKHLMSVNVWHAPHSLGASYWAKYGDTFVNTCVDELERCFPDLKTRIEDLRWISPVGLENELGLTGSNITHGESLLPDFLAD